jgi:hypothetical protein
MGGIKNDSSPIRHFVRHQKTGFVTKKFAHSSPVRFGDETWLSRMASMFWFVTRGDESAFSSLPGDESFVTRSSLVTNPGGDL